MLFVGVWLYPVSNRFTRAGGVILLFGVWLGFIALVWRNRVFRFSMLAITTMTAAFLLVPKRNNHPDFTLLRNDYVAGLRRYNGVRYYWGGESPKGIDCSGLVRRGLIDSLFFRGIRTLDADLIRSSVRLWWKDCSARDLGNCHTVTSPVLESSSINELDHSKLLPGDLGVTRSRVHVMAYLGDRHWIEADPGIDRVITVEVPSKDIVWFQEPMTIVRWNVLQP